MVTSANLEPTQSLSEKDNYCDDCQACNASCPSGLFRYGIKDKVTVTMGNMNFTYSKRRDYNHCNYVCGGHAGLHQSGRWSTWSPARFPIPREDEDIMPVLIEGFKAWNRRPELPGGGLQQPHQYGRTRRDIPLTCGNCSIVCHPEKEERERRLKLLQTSGVIIQHQDGSVEAVSPEEGKKHIAAMDEGHRLLYESANPDSYDPKKYSGRKHHSQFKK
jgi:ferredoxin